MAGSFAAAIKRWSAAKTCLAVDPVTHLHHFETCPRERLILGYGEVRCQSRVANDGSGRCCVSQRASFAAIA